MHTVENQIIGGEGRHYDRLGMNADAIAKAAEGYASDFMSAIRRDRPATMLSTGVSHPADVVSCIGDLLSDNDTAAGLIHAMSLTLNGKYEAGSDALLNWMQDAARKHGRSVAELEALGDL